MRVAALYDVHGNLPALEAVLREVAEAGADRIVFGGDLVPGPMPRETFARLHALDLPAQFIHGNGDREVLAIMRGQEPTTVPTPYWPMMRWVAGQLDPREEPFLASWPLTLRVRIDGIGDVLFCHATPRNDMDIFTTRTPEERLMPLFGSVDADLVVCGHTHLPFDRRVGHVRVVNAGSVGMPFGHTGADWLLLGPDVELRHTTYDLAHAAARIRETAYPAAEEFAGTYVLQPPSEESILEAYAKAELNA